MAILRARQLLSILALVSGMSGAALATPAEDLSRLPNNLALLPDKWIETRPVQLIISFSLKSAPNSAEANAFLKTLRTSMKALPQKMDLKLYRQLTPNRFHYSAVFTFPNWAEYRAHEKDPDFMKYYLASWKPEVVESEEHLMVLDDETGR